MAMTIPGGDSYYTIDFCSGCSGFFRWAHL